jgi:hypothetical protein
MERARITAAVTSPSPRGADASLGILEETGFMKWTAPEYYRGPGSEKGVPRVKTSTSSENATGRSYVQGRLRVIVCQVGGVVLRLRLDEHGSVLVITMRAHSRGILDVGCARHTLPTVMNTIAYVPAVAEGINAYTASRRRS